MSVFSKPFTLFMGPQRSGTSWVDRYLRSRGDICLPSEVKEIFFFDRHFQRGADFYKSHFTVKPRHELIAEVTTTAFDAVEAPRRVFDLMGVDVNLICPLRHPVVRSYSLYKHYLSYGFVTGSIKEATQEAPQILMSSHYAQHLERWFECFGQKNISFLYQEDMQSNLDRYVRKLCDAMALKYKKPPCWASGNYNGSQDKAILSCLAPSAQKYADLLRSKRLYAPINLAKIMGLKPLIFGVQQNRDILLEDIPKEDILWLQERLGKEHEKLELLLGHKISQWD